MLIKESQQLFIQLRKDLLVCRQLKLDKLSEVEMCFQLAEGYWTRLRNQIAEYVFEKPAEEIRFFKEVKPRFTAEVDYYSLRYHAELFLRDEKDPVAIERFWKREAQRLDKFKAEYPDFVAYMKSGSTTCDEQFFIRANSDLSNFVNLRAKAYDLEASAASSHDFLVCNLISLERYYIYVQKQMKATKI